MTFQLCSPPQGWIVNCPLLPLPPLQYNSQGGLVGTRANIGGFDTNIRPAQVEEWSLSIQHQLRNDIVTELQYIGSATHHLSENTDINRFDGDLVQNNGTQTRLNQSFNTMLYLRTNGNSIAHMGSAMITKQMSHNYNLRAIYTWGKVLDYPSSSDDTGVGGSNLVDAENFKEMRGRADFDVTQRLSIDGVWTLPDPFKSSLLKDTIGGWRLGGVSILQSGLPFTVFTTNSFASGLGDFNADGDNYDRPDKPSFGSKVTGVTRSKFLHGIFPASAFPLPVPGSGEGNLGRNTFNQPKYVDADFNAEKVFQTPWLDGRLNFEFRAEMFNAFNHPNLNSVDGNLADGTFADATGQLAPRVIQFKLRGQF